MILPGIQKTSVDYCWFHLALRRFMMSSFFWKLLGNEREFPTCCRQYIPFPRKPDRQLPKKKNGHKPFSTWNMIQMPLSCGPFLVLLVVKPKSLTLQRWGWGRRLGGLGCNLFKHVIWQWHYTYDLMVVSTSRTWEIGHPGHRVSHPPISRFSRVEGCFQSEQIIGTNQMTRPNHPGESGSVYQGPWIIF